MPSRTLNSTAPATNVKSHSTRVSDLHECDSDGDLEEVEHEVISRPVRSTASKSRTLTHLLINTLVNAQFISTTINLFGPTHSSLTSRTFWITQILLELDSVLWRPEYLGREPSDQEMECLADECLGRMWPDILDKVKQSRDEWYRKLEKEGEEFLEQKWSARRSRKGRRASDLEACLRDMKIEDSTREKGETKDDEKSEEEEALCQNYVNVRGWEARKEGLNGQGSRAGHKKSASYSGCGVTYLHGNLSGGDGKAPVKRGIRPGNAGCLLKKILV